MKRSPLWWAAYVAAWQRLRGLRDFDGPAMLDSVHARPVMPIDRGRPTDPRAIAVLCAAEATECEAGYLAAFEAE